MNTRNGAKNKYRSDIKVILVDSDILVNCLQRSASVIIQNSIREGFGLVVSEALYKGTPVVASKIGGIPLQVIDAFNGFVLDPSDYHGFANKIITLLNDEKLRLKLGNNGIAHIKNNFLITRLLLDWLNLFEQHLVT
jgi:trehalose synthase